MRIIAVQGYLLARSFLYEYYKEGNKMDDTLDEIMRILTVINFINSKKHNVLRLVEKAWNRMCNIVGEQDATVQALPFCFRLILKNPSIQDDEKLRILTQKANSQFMFRSEQEIVDAKKIVDEFYKV